MGFWKDVFTDNKPCFAFHIEWDDKPKEGAKELIEENRKLKLMVKKMLEQGITEKKAIDVKLLK